MEKCPPSGGTLEAHDGLFSNVRKKIKNKLCLHDAYIVLSKRPQGAACFVLFFCQHIHFFFQPILSVNGDTQLTDCVSV